jgi:hypothetical protein
MPHDPEEDDLPPDPTDDELDDPLLDRSALVLRPREPMIAWARTIDSGATDEELTASVVAVIPGLRRGPELDRWLEQFHAALFEERLAAWTPEKAQWPTDRSLETLHGWFDVEFVAIVEDFTDCVALPDVTCDPVPIDLLVDAAEDLPEDGALYVDVQRGTIVGLSRDDLEAIDDHDPSRFGGSEEEFDGLLRRMEAGTLVPVLAGEVVEAVDIKEAFADTAKIAGVRNRLLDALGGKKPQRRFREVLDAAGLRKSWREFRRAAIASILVDMLDDYRIPYTPYTGDTPHRP